MLPMPATPPPTPPAIVEQVAPVTVECVLAASQHYSVPVAVLAAVMATEGGEVTKYSTNTNGTKDYGPMQINTVWLPQLQEYGISEVALRDNGCVNVIAGAWILSSHLAKYPTWEAVGSYHSRTPKYKEAYKNRVLQRLRSIKSVKDVIDRANRALFKRNK
jgi:soluble lytic murein transglycosylase-like protein